jgi:hypothetical protein
MTGFVGLKLRRWAGIGKPNRRHPRLTEEKRMKLLRSSGAVLSHAVAFLIVAWLTAAGASIFDWSKAAGSNTTLEGISWAEGMSPAGVNNGIRAIAAALKKWQEDVGGGLNAGGTADALTLTTNSTLASYADGQRLAFVAASSNSGAATLNVDGIGARAIRKVTLSSTNDAALAANDIRANGHYVVQYDASANAAAGAWILLNPAPAAVGTDVQAFDTDLSTWAGTTPGAGVATWLATPSSANLASAVTDETGSGALVFGTAPQISTIELGHASDTTIARASAGEVTIEGNALYRAGGTDVPIGDGGTGASTAAAARTNLGIGEAICVATSDETTAITTGTAKTTFRMPFAMTVSAVRASVNTASSSGTPTVDINEAGTTILSTKLTIDANEKTSTSAASAAVISDTALADDAEITLDHDVAGTGAKGMKVCIIGSRA